MKNDDAPAKKANAKEIESLLKLVIAMAIKSYGFDPNQKKSPIPGDITSDVQRVGGRFQFKMHHLAKGANG